MMRRYAKSIMLVTVMSIGACATTPDPAKICSSEWIAPRAERAMNDFKHDTTKTFKTFRTSAERLKDGSLGPMQMLRTMNALSKLAEKVKTGRGMRDMRTLAQTCDDPNLIKNAMNEFMQKQGISDKFISFINNIEEYTKLLKTAGKSDAKT